MADENTTPFEESKPAGGGGRKLLIVRLGLMALVIAIGAVGGFGLGGLLHSAAPSDADAGTGEKPAAEGRGGHGGGGGSEKHGSASNEEYAYIEFAPITVNLDEPRLSRYVRATIILASRRAHGDAAKPAVEKKMKELHNWLTVYLAGRKLEDVRGEKNLNRIRREIQDAFNELLWPGKAPMIDHVLFKEFAVQ
jgi:flagellar basal body-associated protein FliL